MRSKKPVAQAISLIFFSFLSGCASTHTGDPLEGWNRGAQAFNDKFDQYAMKPVAKGYNWITPEFVDRRHIELFQQS